jgi:uncharacterized protein
MAQMPINDGNYTTSMATAKERTLRETSLAQVDVMGQNKDKELIEMSHAIVWFEIPVNDLKRAKGFYEAIFQTTMMEPPGEMKTAFFPADWQNGEIGGSLIQEEGNAPAAQGTVVYLNAGEDLSLVLDRVEAAGGKIVMPKMKIPMEDAGFIGLFLDSEGNKVGLASPK